MPPEFGALPCSLCEIKVFQSAKFSCVKVQNLSEFGPKIYRKRPKFADFVFEKASFSPNCLGFFESQIYQYGKPTKSGFTNVRNG